MMDEINIFVKRILQIHIHVFTIHLYTINYTFSDFPVKKMWFDVLKNLMVNKSSTQTRWNADR